ncbi:MAG: ATPase, T2SS/T4P/T4SS family [Patescibacteria group bacterium]|nr:ATPase, T2SS/T4P/T4SS family [Patescibacteria group bacterium]
MADLVSKLIDKGIITDKEAVILESDIKTSGKKEEEVIIQKEIFPEKALFQLKSEIMGVPFKEIEAEEVSLKALEFISEESAKYYKMVPLRIEENVLEVGMVYPEDLKAQELLNFLARQSNFSYKTFLITITDFNNILKQYRTLKKEFSRALESLEGELKEEREESIFTEDVGSRPLAEDAPVIKMVAVILKYAVDGAASDVHIEPFKDKSRVRFRIDGILHSSIFLPSRIHPAIVARIKILSNLKIDETRIPQDGRFSTLVYDKEIDFRVSTFPTSLGEKVVMRVLVSGEGVQTLEDLGLEKRNLKIVEDATKKPHGLILATGPTGSGKTTTLYSLMNILNQEEVNIVTLEDPIEYLLKGVNHSQIRPDIGYGFPQGLRHILRQDPDIVMVGEARDEETATLTIHAALTGHIVLSTLHTNNAVGVIPRLIDMGVPAFLIPSALSISIGQRLVGMLCSHCKEKVKVSGEAKKMMEAEIATLPESTKKGLDISFSEVYKAVGCKKCNWRGYKGRIGLFEVLQMTDQLANIVVAGPTEDKIWQEAKRQEMITIRQDGVLKVLRGLTSVEEVLRVGEEA